MADAPQRAEILTGRGSGAHASRSWLGRFLSGVVAVTALAAFAAILVYAYDEGREVSSRSASVVVRAPPGPYKVRPDSPGGMAVPDRDKEVYDRIMPGPPPKRVERLLPPPEQPIARPEPPAVAEATTGPAAPPAPEPQAPAAAPEVAAAPPARNVPELSPAAQAARERDAAIAAIAAVPRKDIPADAPGPAAVASPRPAPPPPAEGAGSYRIQIAALRSEAAARRTWERLQRRYAELLGDLRPSVERADLGAGKGVYYRLQAGPVPDRTAALRLCADLEQRKVGCLVVRR